jgi:hypothetical protein
MLNAPDDIAVRLTGTRFAFLNGRHGPSKHIVERTDPQRSICNVTTTPPFGSAVLIEAVPRERICRACLRRVTAQLEQDDVTRGKSA